jgi:RNA polymerase sigma factor (sigma-70 family)
MVRPRVLSSQKLAQLWREHSATLLLLARSYGESAEDCVQEAFIRLATQEPIPDSPVAWLFRVVRNEAVSQLRSQKRLCDRESLVAREQPRWFEPAAAVDDNFADIDEIKRGLAALEDTTRDILAAHIWGNMTFREIADAFGVSSATAHRSYQLGIQRLQKIVESE